MNEFVVGQRWISEMEPELGMGIVMKVDPRFVTMHFSAADVQRKYAIASSPLKRVEFKAGDSIQLQDGRSITVVEVSSAEGLFFYHDEKKRVSEKEISDQLSFTSPMDRFQRGFFDNNNDFDLRKKVHKLMSETDHSDVRGFIGGRIDLLPHQLYVANAVSSSIIPRFLLSDETGLGKTIEVCLILHRLLSIGQINRVLIVVPESLVNQWFIELFRRFNLIFQIFDHEYCHSVIETEPEANPFLESQVGIVSLTFITEHPQWSDLAVKAGWDMLVVDEAHHLVEGSDAYLLIEKLGTLSEGLLLLTATPEQLGHKSHFARLRLIDPGRYFDFGEFEKEEDKYLDVARYINELEKNNKTDAIDLARINKLLPAPLGTNLPKEALIKELQDRFGTGRAIFRNTRNTLTGFPERVPILISLEGDDRGLANLQTEYRSALNGKKNEVGYEFNSDPRISWIVDFCIKNSNKKVLLICSTQKKAEAVESAILKQAKIKLAVFHERRTLLQRDRSAAWFAEKEGAQLLICSEIGSEGRNFQFAHNLVLFDLPLNPELLEQRIGRLDRIGQQKDINIHVLFVRGSEYELLAKWYDKGLNAFSENVPGVFQVFQSVRKSLEEVLLSKDPIRFNEILERTYSLCIEARQKISEGRDRLLELNSFQPDEAKRIKKKIEDIDSNEGFPRLVFDIFNLYGIREEDIADKLYRLHISALSDQAFPLPVINKDEIYMTFNRKLAIEQEDLLFITRDHPIIEGAFDLILGTEKGNCAAVTLSGSGNPGLLLETVFILEAIAPKKLNIERFLGPTPLISIVDSALVDQTKKFDSEIVKRKLKNGIDPEILDNPVLKQEIIPAIYAKCEERTEEKRAAIVKKAAQLAEKTLSVELERLLHLKEINNYIREEEISILKDRKKAIAEAIKNSRIRLDSIRIILQA